MFLKTKGSNIPVEIFDGNPAPVSAAPPKPNAGQFCVSRNIIYL